ncbi:MAG TPA: hypothetical protein VMU28_12125 [Terriglobales bacterium]|nr:hypothetical protein [Terriglobales bacterium]
MSKLRVLVLLILAVTAVFAQDKPAPERYTATAIGTGGGVGGKTLLFNFNITRYTTDEEVQQLAALLKEKGQDALVSAMEKLDCGRIYPVASTGNTIAVARKRVVDGIPIITIVTARQMSFTELTSMSRTKQYPFGFVQVKLNPNNKDGGTGQIMAAAKIRFDKKKGNYEIESYGNQYIKAVNVRADN